MRQALRKVARAAALTALAVMALVAAAHLSPVRTRVVTWGITWLRTHMGIEARADRVSYNLLRLDISVNGLTLAARGSEATPFLSIDTLHANAPWSLLRGRMAANAIEASGVRIDIVRRADGSSNLPFSAGSQGAGVERFDVGRLIVRQADVTYRDEANALLVDVQGVSLDLRPQLDRVIAGTLAIERGPRIRVGERESMATHVAGRVAFDGTSLLLNRVSYESAEGQLVAEGRLDSVLANPRADIRMEGTVLLTGVSRWLKLEPTASGTVAVRGSLTGVLTDPVARLSLDSSAVSWRHLREVSLRAEARLNTSGVDLEAATLGIGGGAVKASGRVATDGGRVRVDWRAVPAGSVLGPLVPVPLAALLEGTADATWSGEGWQALGLVAENRARPVVAEAGSVPIDGRASLAVERGEWRLGSDHQLWRSVRVAGNLAGRLSDRGLSASSLSGPGVVSAPNLGRIAPLLRRAGVTAPAWLDEVPGSLTVDFGLAGLLGTPRVTAAGRVDGFDVAGAGPGQLTFQLAADRRRISVVQLDASMGANHLTGSGSLDLGSDALRATAQLELSDLPRLASRFPAEWRPSGRMVAHADLGGVLANPTVIGSVEGQALMLANQRIDAMSGSVNYANGRVALEDISIQQRDGGRFSAGAEYVISNRTYSLSVSASGLNLTPIGIGEGRRAWPVNASVAVEFSGSGTIDHPRGTGQLAFQRLSWGDSTLGRAEVGVELSDTGAQLDAHLLDLSSTIRGRVQLGAPWAFDLSADVVDGDLSAFAPLAASGAGIPLGSRLTGRATLTASAMGTFRDPAASTVAAALKRLEVRTETAELRLLRETTFNYDRSRLAVDHLDLRTGNTTMAVAGELAESESVLRVAVTGELADVQTWLEAFDLAGTLQLRGAMKADLMASGSLRQPALSGDLAIDGARVAISTLPPIEDVSFGAQLADGVVDVRQVRARWQGATVSGGARVSLRLFEAWLPEAIARQPGVRGQEAVLTARLDDLTSDILEPFVGEIAREKLEGRASASIELRTDALDLERVRGSLTLDRLDANAAGVALTELGPTRLELAAGRVRVARWTWDVSGNQLTVSGDASLTSRELNLSVNGLVDLRAIGAFVPATTGGFADISVRLHGPMAAPLTDGTLQIRDGELRLADPAMDIAGLTGRVVLEGPRLRVVDVEGTANGGHIALSGELHREQLSLTSGVLTLDGRQIGLNVPQGFRSEVDAALSLSVAESRGQLSGRVTILRGAYREPMSVAQGLIAAARRREVVVGGGPESASLRQLELNIAVSSAEDLIVDNNYGRMDVGVDVRMAGTAAQPLLLGRATVREGGVLYLGGRVYQIENGIVDFVGENEIRPDLNMTARTRISGYDITLTMTGTPDALEGRLSSDPSLGQSDIVSLLVTGRMAADTGGAGTAIAREQVLGYLSGEVLGFAARAVGLDTLRLERGGGLEALRSEPSLIAGEVDPSSRLTLSKSLSRYVEVVLSQDLRESGNLTWIVSALPRRGFEARAVSRDDRSRSYEVRHDVSVGRAPTPTRAPTLVTPPPTRVERVAAVRFAGSPGVAERELTSLLKLGRGDLFDFYRWQSDRDRLRRFYLDRGYLEARVTARRVDSGGEAGRGGIVLEYEIDQGPRTRLLVEGRQLPSDVLHDLETLWSNAVFEEALFADLRRRVLTFLVSAGYVRADVTVSRALSPVQGEKQIRIRVATGERSASREMLFVGNQSIPTSQLRLLVQEPGLALASWLEPSRLAEAVTDLYHDEGLLAASAEVGPPEFTGKGAVLPVRIHEGTRFSIGEVVISGLISRSDREVRQTFGQQRGSPYTRRGVEAARRAVEAEYRQRGFNAVRMVVQIDVDPVDMMAHLRLQVEEGAQQVLQAVEVEGAEGLRPGIVSRALALKAGEPADMTSWYEGRRRLLDTGLFQRVDVEAMPAAPAAPAPSAVEPVAARVTLQRWPAWRLRYGLQVADEPAPASDARTFRPGVTADLQRRTLFGRATSLGTSLRFNGNQRIGRLFVSVPDFFTLPLSSTIFLSRSHERVSESGFGVFVTDKTTLTAEQRFKPGQRLQLSYGYQFERNHTFDPKGDPRNPLRFDVTFRAARLTSTALFDTRDDPFDASRGLLHSSTFEYAPEALGSDVRFVKYFVQQFYYRPVGRHVVSASAIRLGAGRGFGQELIPSERFFAGGANSVRGYAENSLGGVDFFGLPRGGQAVVVLNQEARFPIFRWIRGVALVDAGNTFDRAGNLSLTRLKAGIGAGLRLTTPVGLFRVDFGAPLSAENGRRTPRWYFSLGQAF